jgi:transposase InsO family protein
VLQGREPVRAVAAGTGVSGRTVRKWVQRFRREGVPGLRDRSSRPHRSPRATAPAVVARIVALRRRRWTEAQIAAVVGVSEATVARRLRPWGLARVPALEAAPPVLRYERAHPGERLHVDTKPLGRIGRVGHRITGDRRGRARGIGWEYAHVCVDDASRLAYAEILPNEHPGTACGFLRRAVAWLRGAGVTGQRVMSDNGNPYRSHAFARLCPRLGLRHVRTRPYTPRTNGKAERFIQTLMRQWAYGRAYPTSRHRRAVLPRWLHYYNVHRPHASLGDRPPISRLPTGNNLVTAHT